MTTMNEERAGVPDFAGIGRDAGHPRAVVLYLRTEPTDGDLRAIQEALRFAAAPAQPAAHDQGEAQRLRKASEAIREFEKSGWHGSKGYHAGLLKAAQIVDERAASTGQEAAHVSVPKELLQDLRDLAQDAVDHHRQAYASYKLERQANMDQVIANADTLLNGGEV